MKRRRVRHATLNCLGASHTDSPKGNKWGRWAKSKARTGWLRIVVRYRRLDLLSLQEFQSPQARVLTRALRDRYTAMMIRDNAVLWRSDRFKVVASTSFAIPYFGGHEKDMPLVVLRDKRTGELYIVDSVHNPANVKGEAGHWRREGWKREDQAVRRMLAKHPGAHVIVAGDRNAKSDDYAKHVPAGTTLITRGVDKRDIDHIAISWPSLLVRKVFAVDKGRINKITDHPLIVAVLEPPKEKP